MSAVQDTASKSFRPLRDGFRYAALSVALVLAIAACGGDNAETDAAAQPETAAQPAQAPAPAVSAQVAAMSVEQLRDAARVAQTEQRMYAPASNNASCLFLSIHVPHFT